MIQILDLSRGLDRQKVQNILTRRKAGQEGLSPRHAAVHRKAFGRVFSPSQAAERIIQDVRRKGLSAVLRYTRLFGGPQLGRDSLRVPSGERREALKKLPKAERRAMETAIRNIESFARRGRPTSWSQAMPGGGTRGERFLPLDSVGITVPSQAAPLPSTLIMNAVPARVAGVRRIYVVTGTGVDGLVHPAILAAAELCGVETVFRVGGVQALAALAFGVSPFPKVDKISGPGNAFVAAAKKILQGEVGTDGRHLGPSEVLFLTDGSANPSWAAADLLAQAEHDEMALPMAVSWNRRFLERLQVEIEIQLRDLPRQRWARAALVRGALFLVPNRAKAFRLSNLLAPEHLTLATVSPKKDLARITSAGAVFLGEYTPEAAADYAAGPNHVLPTAGTAGFDSPLSVRDFMKATNVLDLSRGGLSKLGTTVPLLARMEGLEAHARSVEIRLKTNTRSRSVSRSRSKEGGKA